LWAWFNRAHTSSYTRRLVDDTMPSFVPVYDQEKARCEQNEEELRKHRQFDTPFAKLADDLNQPKQPRDDLGPLGKPTGDLYLDEDKLWRKKKEVFERKFTWGRETFEYADPEATKGEQDRVNWNRPGVVGWGVQGNFGGRREDTGTLIVQRKEVDQKMVKNEKGLWVRQKAPTNSEGSNTWRCVKCAAENPNKRSTCVECFHEGGPGPSSGSADSLLRPAKSGEDPRLEAAKPKGRNCADAAQRALEALEARRRKEKHVKESLGMMHRQSLGSHNSAGATTLNSSSQQVRPAKRVRKFTRWQGVQRTDEEAREVVAKAEGLSSIGKSSSPKKMPDTVELVPDPASDSASALASSDEECARKASCRERKSGSRSRFQWQSRSPSHRQNRNRRSKSRQRQSRSPSRKKNCNRRSRSRRRSRQCSPHKDGDAADGDVVVDFF